METAAFVVLTALATHVPPAFSACDGLGTPSPARPEVITPAVLIQTPPLDPEILKRSHVDPENRARGPHLTYALEKFRVATINAPANLDVEAWRTLVRLVTGAPNEHVVRALGDAKPLIPSLILTLRASLPPQNLTPVAALRLGRQHYLLDLRSYRGVKPARLMSIYRRAGRPPAPAPKQPAWLAIENIGAPPLPGAWASRGTFRARLVAEYSPGGEQEILLNPELDAARAIHGSWAYDHEFLILRILLKSEQVKLFEARERR